MVFMATALLHMQDFGVETCEAAIVSIGTTEDGRTDITLDQTCFYARGGGQDWDKGIIRSADSIFAVEEVRLDESGIVHHIGVITSGQFEQGGKVHCEVDRARRTINMRLHSAAHVIDMAIADLGLDWVVTKGQHYPHLSAVEYSGTWDSAKAEELRAKLELRANECVKRGSVNTIHFMPVSEMYTVCRHIPANIPANKPGRVVMYGENFGIPCGGTHVKNIREVGKVTIPKLKEKKSVIRISYAVEGIMP